MATFQERLKDLREDKNLSQRQLAKELNTLQANIQRWEKGTADPSSANVIKIAQYFKVSAGYLLGLED